MWEDEPFAPTPEPNMGIDERYMPEWINFGISEFERVLKNHSAFLDWLDRQHDEEG